MTLRLDNLRNAIKDRRYFRLPIVLDELPLRPIEELYGYAHGPFWHHAANRLMDVDIKFDKQIDQFQSEYYKNELRSTKDQAMLVITRCLASESDKMLSLTTDQIENSRNHIDNLIKKFEEFELKIIECKVRS